MLRGVKSNSLGRRIVAKEVKNNGKTCILPAK
nr:MAG TPA: hypothetical protein [Caudoviricetes sp.]